LIFSVKNRGEAMKLQDVILRLLLEQPLYGFVAASVKIVETNKVETIRMASLPDLVIQYNPIWFDQMTIKMQRGVVLHELLHVILLHQYRRENRQLIPWNVACDMAVNEMLPTDQLEPDAVTVAKVCDKLKLRLEREQNAEYYYNKIVDLDDIHGLTATSGDSFLIFEGESNLKVRKMSEDTATKAEISALKSNLAQTLSDAKSDSEAFGLVDERIEEVYLDIRMDWRVILKRFVTGRGKMITRKSYKRQSRRYEELPGTKRSIGVNALIAIDESGSISDTLVKEFYQELKEINKITGTNMLVTRFDTECSEPIPLGTFVVSNKRIKRGGTDFRPIFKLADENKIPLVIIFTDGDGEAPVSVNQNTLWILTKKAKKPANFGYFLNFEE
jgi:predicted metal-dependent peptidase